MKQIIVSSAHIPFTFTKANAFRIVRLGGWRMKAESACSVQTLVKVVLVVHPTAKSALPNSTPGTECASKTAPKAITETMELAFNAHIPVWIAPRGRVAFLAMKITTSNPQKTTQYV